MAKNDGGMALGARACRLSTLIAESEFTDAQGRPLDQEEGIAVALDLLRVVRSGLSRVFVIGNGGSAGVAGHAVTDFVNVGKVPAQTLHDASLLTCMANDYGYENAFARMLSILATAKDALVAISSSGKSPNICNAALAARQAGMAVITLSGFEPNNPLRMLGDLNIWIASRDYGLVEIGHQFVLHNFADRFGQEQGRG